MAEVKFQIWFGLDKNLWFEDGNDFIKPGDRSSWEPTSFSGTLLQFGWNPPMAMLGQQT
ncbi:hypothetical protein [Desulfopila sp. IMCC35008]|uniref:hypothetical protein n=1 Tax=Desulfopila sp. IMCC35008 TaxID=2653858 RepID=UPI0013D77D1B|nr:hypothetical protein [Desulfopila sp. IMCC35008]